MEECIPLHFPSIDACWFEIIPTREAFVITAGFAVGEMVFASYFKRRKPWGGRRNLTVERHTAFMDIPFIRTSEEVAYKGQLYSLMTQL